ncbi:MAG: hypothetical protein ABIQ89_03290 [Candidatus Saccharimonadales bacterium]
MIEVRRDLELPTVQDGDPQAVPKMAEALLQVIDGDIPAVGIDHTASDLGLNHIEVHNSHQRIIFEAAKIIKPEVVMGDSFDKFGGLQRDAHQPLHNDRPIRMRDEELWSNSGQLSLVLFLRLHTADGHNGASVTLANSRPGIDPATARDGAVYRLRGDNRQTAFEELGYDPTLEYLGARISPEAATGIYEGASGVDGTRISGDIYSYTQKPLSSVLFRSRAALGSVTLHGFRSLDASQERTFHLSNITAYSQLI